MSQNLRLSIIQAIAKSNPGMLTQAERNSLADSIDPAKGARYDPPPKAAPKGEQRSKLARMIAHQLNGGTLDGPATPVGTPTDIYAGLSPHDARQLQYADLMMTIAVREGREVNTHHFMQLFNSLNPTVQERVTALYHYYGDINENRMPFMPKISPEDFMVADGLDKRVAGETFRHIETATTGGGLIERMEESDSEATKAARKERESEKPNSERHSLRETIENAQAAHEFHNTGASDLPDASETFRELNPSVRASVSAVMTVLSPDENS